MRKNKTILTGLITCLVPAAVASAGLVSPGQSVTLTDGPSTPSGTLVASRSAGFVIDYGDPVPTAGFDGKLAGTLSSAVYRQAGGSLTFVYGIDLGNPANFGSAAEGSSLTVASFGGFSTSLTGGVGFDLLALASRSADGKAITLAGGTPGLGGPPTLVVSTDASAYNANGHATYAAADEVPTADGESRSAFGSAMVDGLLQPVATDPGTPSNPPTAIPLPPAAFTGAGVLLAMMLIATTRRFWTVPV